MKTQRTEFRSSAPRWCRLGLALVMAGFAPSLVAQDESFELEESPPEQEADAERLAELTQTRNWVEVGAIHVGDDAGRFGRYTGLDEPGSYGVLAFDLAKRLPYDAPVQTYWRFTGTDVGLPSGEVAFEAGKPGRYEIRLGYDGMTALRADDARSIYPDAGSARLLLPAGWVPAQNTAGMSALASSLRDIDLKQVRRRFDLGFDAVLRERWDFGTEFRRETKDGNRSLGAVIGNSGGNPRAVILPEPIDYVTDRFDAVMRFTDPRKQFQLAYHGSIFHNANEALTWQNPYVGIGGWNATAGFPDGYGSLSLPPDNQFHQLSAAGAWSVSERARFSADVALGRMTQDETFLPYSVNPTLVASITQPLPRSSLDGEIDTTVVNLKWAARPTDAFFWNAALRYDDRDNQTPRDEYVYIGGDSQTQNTAATSSFRRYNEPYSFREEKFRVDAGYRASGRFSVSAAAERRRTERTYSERERADEDALTLGVRGDLSDRFSAGLRVGTADRDGSTYIGNEPFLSSYAPGYTNTVPGAFENPPTLRKFHEADRRRRQATLYATLTPSAAWSFSLDAGYSEDDYRASELGLTFTRSNQISLDATYAPTAEWSAYGFYAYEKLAFDQDGRSIGGASRVADASNSLRDWFADHRDYVDSYGVGFLTALADSRWSAGADLVRSRSDSNIYVSTGSALTARALPGFGTRLDAASAYVRYRRSRAWSVWLRYWFERYHSSDFALDDVEPNQLANVILMGEGTPDYRVHAIGVSLSYEF